MVQISVQAVTPKPYTETFLKFLKFFDVIGSSFFWERVKLLAEQLWQIWRRYAPPFFRYLRKT